MKMPLGAFVNVTLMAFIEFTSVYDILSDSKLRDELEIVGFDSISKFS